MNNFKNINNIEEEKLPVHLSIDDEKCESVGYYEGDIERTTLDSEWTESELEDNVYDEVVKELEKLNKTEKLQYRALKDKGLNYPEFIANKIKDENDLIEVYNKLYDSNKNNKEGTFIIHFFDAWIHSKTKEIVKNNIIS